MDDWIEIGIFAEGDQPGKPFYAQKHRIRSGEQTITVRNRASPPPASIPITTIDLETGDNISAVRAKS
jgi:hypothetical protein